MTEQATTQLIQRESECEFWYRQSASNLTLQISDALGRISADRDIVSAAVYSVGTGSITFRMLKDDYASMVVGTHREDMDADNANESIQWNSVIDRVQPFDSCTFPVDVALGAASGASYVVKKVDKEEDPGDSDYFLDTVWLYDAVGGAATIPAALASKTVSFSDKTRVHPAVYELSYIAQTGSSEGDFVSIPRPTGSSSDQYTLDPVSGSIALNATWVSARPTSTYYCFVLEFTRFDRVNEVKATDVNELRTVMEGITKARYGLTITSQAIEAERSVQNYWQSKVDPANQAQIIRDAASDWWFVSDPICTAVTTSLANYGLDFFTEPLGTAASSYGAEFKMLMRAKIPILIFEDTRLLSVSSDWTVVSAKLHYKATRITGERTVDTINPSPPPAFTTTTTDLN